MVTLTSTLAKFQEGLLGGNRVYYTVKANGGVKEVAWHDGFAWVLWMPSDDVTEATFVDWASAFHQNRSHSTITPTRVDNITG